MLSRSALAATFAAVALFSAETAQAAAISLLSAKYTIVGGTNNVSTPPTYVYTFTFTVTNFVGTPAWQNFVIGDVASGSSPLAGATWASAPFQVVSGMGQITGAHNGYEYIYSTSAGFDPITHLPVYAATPWAPTGNNQSISITLNNSSLITSGLNFSVLSTTGMASTYNFQSITYDAANSHITVPAAGQNATAAVPLPGAFSGALALLATAALRRR